MARIDRAPIDRLSSPDEQALHVEREG